MRTLLLCSLLSLGTLAGCSKSDSKKTEPGEIAEAKVPEISVDQLDAMLAKNECQAVDANGDGTRKKLGVIPGAVLLTDSETFASGELPADKNSTLVFYCANTQCGASHEAASKALAQGYKNAKVLPDGIAGWVKAGKKVQTI
jgi:rhodanese-related sulfurtransferase